MGSLGFMQKILLTLFLISREAELLAIIRAAQAATISGYSNQ